MASRPRPAVLALTALAVLLTLSLAACDDGAPKRYVNEEYGFSFLPPKDWRFTATKTSDCLVKAEAEKDADCRIYVCVAPRFEGVITMRDDFLNCEQIRAFIRDSLRGQNPQCEPAHTWRLRAYQAKYLRLVKHGDGQAWQFVDQKYLIREPLMFTVTAYTIGDTPEAARAVYERNVHPLSLAMDSLYFQ